MSASEWITPLLHHAYQTARLAVTFLVFQGASFVWRLVWSNHLGWVYETKEHSS